MREPIGKIQDDPPLYGVDNEGEYCAWLVQSGGGGGGGAKQ